LWRITASAKYIGEEFKTRWWENLALALLFGLAVYGAVQAGAGIVGGTGR
jgi:hypothetical protein